MSNDLAMKFDDVQHFLLLLIHHLRSISVEDEANDKQQLDITYDGGSAVDIPFPYHNIRALSFSGV